MAGALVPVASYESAGAFFDCVDPDYFRLERGFLEHQPYQCKCSAVDRVYRLLFEPGRPFLGEVIRRIAPCSGSYHGAWLAHPKTARAGLNLWRSEVVLRLRTRGLMQMP